MTASSVTSVASAKIELGQLEQMARALRVEIRVGDSNAALFRRCLERVTELATLGALDRLDRATGRVRVVAVEAEGNAEALAALGAFNAALGGQRDGRDEAAEAPPPDSGC